MWFVYEFSVHYFKLKNQAKLKHLILVVFLTLLSPAFGQVDTIDRSDTSIHIVHNYWAYDHWMAYPATSAVYIPPCIYRIVPPDTNLVGDWVRNKYERFQLVEQYGKYGIVNEGDTIIIPIQYDSLINVTNSWPKVFIAQVDQKFGLLNADNEIVIPFEYDRIHLMTNGHYTGIMNSSLKVEKDGKQGLMRVDGSIELTCKYDYINTWCGQTDCPKEGVQYHVGIDGKYGYINKDESIAIPLEYESLSATGFSGLIKAKKNGVVGLMDTLENFILAPEYEQLFSESMMRYPNLTAFKKDGKWGLMCGEYSNMRVILENRFDSVITDYRFENHFVIINKGKWGLADTNGKVVIKPQFQQIEAMEDGTFAYKKGGKWGFMNQSGFLHCSPRYDSIYDNQKNWCLVTKGEGFGLCKTSGNQIVAPIYDIPVWDDYLHWEEIMYAGHIALSKGNYESCKMGVIDSNGRVILPFEYECWDELMYNFGTCLIAKKNGKDVLINADGEEVYLGDYDEIDRREEYDGEYFFPMKGEKMGLVSPEGKLLATAKYDRIEILSLSSERFQNEGIVFLIEKDSKVGILDSNGRTVLAPIHEELALKENSLVEVFSGSGVKLYNLKTRKYEPFSAFEDYHFNGQIGAFRGLGGKSFFIDASGNRINEDNYEGIWLTGPNSNYFEVKKAGKYGICDSTGKPVFEPKFSKIKYWDGEFGAGKIGNSYCFFDAKGDTIVGYRYEKVKGVYNDFVCVRIDNRFGVVTKTGEVVIEPTLNKKLNFKSLDEFGLILIWENYKAGAINSDMKVVLDPEFTIVEFIKVHGKTWIMGYKDGVTELYDVDGNAISDHQFIKWEWTDTGEFFILNKWGWYRINEDGEMELIER